MTILIGLLCQDGVVIGADSSATSVAGNIKTVEQPTKKITVISDRIIVAGTGSRGLGQRFAAVVQKESDQKLFSKDSSYVEIGKRLSAAGLTDFVQTGAQSPVNFGALVAFPCGSVPHLCELEAGNLQPEFKDANGWWVSMGSGQLICDPFLGFIRRVFWKNHQRPKLNEGIFAVAWALHHAVDVNPGGIKDPTDIAILEFTKSGAYARILDGEDVSEHYNHVTEIEKYISRYADLFRGTSSPQTVPEIAKPDGKQENAAGTS